MNSNNSFLDYKNKVASIITEYDKACANAKITDKGYSVSIKDDAEPFLKGCFTLAVVGKMSAGKSTFINALLKDQELLPTGHFQTTCAITEISYSENNKLEIVYGDRRKVIFNSNIKEELIKSVSIADEFQKLPLNHINELILSGKKEKDIISVTPELRAISGFDIDDNLLSRYVKSHPKSSIPIEIIIHYKLNPIFKGWRIVDTPGIAAIGGIQDRTRNYLSGRDDKGRRNVDAVIFVHSGIDNIQDASIHKFFNETFSELTEQIKARSFFVLTHASHYKFLRNKKEILEFASDLFAKDGLRNERIMAIDSMLELFCEYEVRARGTDPMFFTNPLGQIPEGFTIDEFEEFTSAISEIALQVRRLGKEVNSETLTQKIEEVAGFEKLHLNLNEFIKTEFKNSFESIIKKVRNDLNGFADKKNVDLSILKRGMQQKQEEFSRNIKKKQGEIDILLVKTQEDIVDIDLRYSRTAIDKYFDPIVHDFKKLINKCHSIKSIQNCFIRFSEFILKRQDDLFKEIKSNLKVSLENKEFFENYSLDRLDFDDIEKSSRNRSIENITEKVKKSGILNKIIRGFGLFSQSSSIEDFGYEIIHKKIVNEEKMLKEYRTEAVRGVVEEMINFKLNIKSQIKDFARLVQEEYNLKIEKRKIELGEMLNISCKSKAVQHQKLDKLSFEIDVLKKTEKQIIKIEQ